MEKTAGVIFFAIDCVPLKCQTYPFTAAKLNLSRSVVFLHGSTLVVVEVSAFVSTQTWVSVGFMPCMPVHALLRSCGAFLMPFQ